MLEVNGVGYEIEAPMSTFYCLPSVGENTTLETHLLLRDDVQLIYGFATPAEKTLFRALIKISGVGPKVALALLSGISVNDFWAAVRSGESARLTKMPGIGKRTAERIMIELRDRDRANERAIKEGDAATISEALMSPLAEAQAALEGLGYKTGEAQRLSEAVYQSGMSTDQVIREALKRAVR